MSAGPARVHQCLVHDAEEQAAAVAAPLLRAGLRAGEVVAVHGSARLVAAVAGAVDDDRLRVLVHEGPTTVPAVVTELQRYVQGELARGARGLRVVGEPDLGPGPRGWAERLRYEAVIDHLLQDVPVRAVCTVDSRRVPASAAASLLAAHSHLAGPRGRPEPNPAHRAPAELLEELEPRTDPLEGSAPVVDLTGVAAPAAARDAAREVAMGTRLPAGAADGLVVAVSEVVTNALVHGLPPVRLRVWADADRVLCAVTDAGPGHDGALAGYRLPRAAPLSGAGLWAARQLVASVRARRDATGFTVLLDAVRPGSR